MSAPARTPDGGSAPSTIPPEAVVLTGIVVVLHIIVSLLLIMFILLKSGRGGGLSDMFGGGAMSAMTGSTVVERNLDRLTIITGVVFALTTVILALRLT
ncbi:MAG TPA: preprotein translocase subunit SecG [Egibacteraceae bacterium]|mgnify:CR=1 FL=1